MTPVERESATQPILPLVWAAVTPILDQVNAKMAQHSREVNTKIAEHFPDTIGGINW